MRPLAPGYRVVPAVASDLPHLPEVERAACALFPPGLVPEELLQRTVPMETLEAATARGSLWVALAPEGTVVGFALAGVVDGLHVLMEMDVHPQHGQRGVGHHLLSEAVAWARRARAGALYLTTFAAVPWNAPMYARAGFAALEDPGTRPPAVERLLALEASMGLRGRVAMALPLAPARSTWVVVLHAVPGQRAALAAFEALAVRIMARHGGVMERRLGIGAGSATDGPAEVHVVSFPDDAALERYRQDPELAALAPLRAQAVARTDLWRATDLQGPQGAERAGTPAPPR